MPQDLSEKEQVNTQRRNIKAKYEVDEQRQSLIRASQRLTQYDTVVLVGCGTDKSAHQASGMSTAHVIDE